MVLSNTLFNTLTNKLKLETSLIEKEKFHVKNLLNQTCHLKNNNFKISNTKQFFNFEKKINSEDFFIIAYIINISFLKANTIINVSDPQGNLKLFYSAGSVNLTGKQKKKRRIALSKLISLIFKKATFLVKKPIALHLNNVNFYKNLIVKKLKRNLYIKVVKIVNKTPYNGCRKKKIRRKKYTKKFK